MSLSNNDYQDIMRQYEERRLSNYRLHEQRKKDIYTTIPEIRDLDRQITSNSISLGKQLIVSDDPALRENYRKKNHVLIEKKQALLHEAGYSSDYLEPIYHCKKCKDTGYIGNQKCHCFKKAIIGLLYDQSNIKKFPVETDFSNFRLDYYPVSHYDKKTGRSSRSMMEDTLRICHHFIDSFGTEFNNLFFYGDVGVGKTFLSTCIAKEIMNREYSVLYFSAPQLFNTLAKNAFDKNDIDAHNMCEYIFDCDLLIIDDLGTEYTNAFIASQFFTCINERLLHRKSTIISTNLSLESLADLYTERSFSRITSRYSLLKIVGDDIRIKKKLEH